MWRCVLALALGAATAQYVVVRSGRAPAVTDAGCQRLCQRHGYYHGAARRARPADRARLAAWKTQPAYCRCQERIPPPPSPAPPAAPPAAPPRRDPAKVPTKINSTRLFRLRKVKVPRSTVWKPVDN